MSKTDKPYSSIVVKILAQLFLVIFVLSAIFIITDYNTLYSELLKKYERAVEQQLNHNIDTANQSFDGLRQDTTFLAHLPLVALILKQFAGVNANAGREFNENKIALQQVMQSLIGTRSNYFQIRLISYSNNGREVVRVDRELASNHITVIPESQLQEKGHRDYVKKSKTYPLDAVFLSDIQLNREHGEISQPATPTIRSIVKVRGDNQDALGIIVINYAIDNLLQSIASSSVQSATQLYLWNSDGEFLVHPDKKATFAFEYNHSSNVKTQFPELFATGVNYANHGNLGYGTDLFRHLGRNLFATRTLNLGFDEKIDSRPITMALVADYEKITEPAKHSLLRSMLILSLLIPLVTLASVYFSRKISRPIKILNDAVKRYDADSNMDLNELEKLSYKSNDEAGVLARSFLSLHKNLEKSNQFVKENELRLNTIFSSMGDGVITIDKTGKIIYVNPRAEEIFGYGAGELVGNSVNLLMTDEHSHMHNDYLKNYFMSGRSEILGMQRELRSKTKKGDVIYIDPIVTRSEVHGEVIFSAVVRDITQRKQDEILLKKYALELKRSNEELNNFAYVASHDLKAPLRNIWQVSSWIEDEIDDKEAILRNLALIKSRANKMQQLLNDLLEYSRVGRGDKDVREFDSNAILHDAFDLLNSAGGFELKFQGSFPKLNQHQTLFEMVFRNLFDNAIKHHDKSNGNIVVSCRKHDEYYLFTVKDDGPGIDTRYIEKIFDFLSRINTKSEGSGLGLSLVRKIMDSIGGKVTVESSPGEGATFTVFWPGNDDRGKMNKEENSLVDGMPENLVKH